MNTVTVLCLLMGGAVLGMIFMFYSVTQKGNKLRFLATFLFGWTLVMTFVLGISFFVLSHPNIDVIKKDINGNWGFHYDMVFPHQPRQ